MNDVPFAGVAVWALLLVALIVVLGAARKRYREICKQYRDPTDPE